MELRRIDLDALLTAHAFMRVDRPPEPWQVDVEDEPFIRMLGEMIVVGLLHHDVLAELTLNASNVTVGDDGPDGVAPGDHVAVTVHGPGAWERDMTWTRVRGASGAPTVDAAVRAASVSFGYLGAAPVRRRDPSRCSSLDRSRRKSLRTLPDELLEHADVDIVDFLDRTRSFRSGFLNRSLWQVLSEGLEGRETTWCLRSITRGGER